MTHLLEQDKKQRQLALDASLSFIVQAPAGSGKTELLIQRFLILLNTVNAPEEILAITFTKKSANEMRLRIVKALKQALTNKEPESPHAKKTWFLAKQVLLRDQQLNWNLINNPNQLSIQTIDSLCAYLTLQLPLLSHFGSKQEIADNPLFLYRAAVQEILSHVEENFAWSQAIANLLLHLDNDLNKLQDLLIHLLAKRDQWLPHIHLDNDDKEIKKYLENHLAMVIGDHLALLNKLIPKESIPELLAIANFAACNRHADPLSALPGTKTSDKPTWLYLANLLLTKNLTWRKRVEAALGFPSLASLKDSKDKYLHSEYRQRFADLIITLSAHDDLKTALAELFFLPDAHYSEEQWGILQSLLLILKILAAQLRITFQQHAQIDFIENAQAARMALGSDENPTDLALALDYQIKHILIDEFQDTSFSQYELLEKLIAGWEEGDGRTLFVVGDPMQSIYRFREAEVGLFLRMCHNGIGHIKLHPLTLTVNFRSSEKIVAWNNAHFQTIFPPFNNMANGAVIFNASVAHHAFAGKDTDIQIYALDSADDKDQAASIVKKIADIKNSAPQEKIAILVRSRSHLTALIPALKQAAIPYRAVEIDSLASKQPIQDVLSLTYALMHPADRIAWLAVLRAPWCGLTLNDLFIIAGENPYISIWEQLEKKDMIARLSDDGQIRIRKLFSILKNKMAARERNDLRFWIESTWLQLGGPASLTSYDEITDIQAYFKLLEEFSQKNEIIDRDKLKEKINQLYAPAQHEDDVLQIMTIHSAKGLEFDTVILPHLERKMPNDEKSLLAWLECPLSNDKSALLLASIHGIGNKKDPLYEYINRQHKIKSDYEIDRLLYVAATRAKKRLYLYFNVKTNEENEIECMSGSFLSRLWPSLKTKPALMIPPQTASKREANLPRYIKRFNITWSNPIQDMEIIHAAAHQQQAGFQLFDDKAKFIGIVVHRILQAISEQGIAWWLKESSAQQHNYIKQQLLPLFLLPANLDSAIMICSSAIKNTLNDAHGRWILKPHREAKSEFAISVNINGIIENRVIDRTFIDENNTRWIIDYKTTSTNSSDLETFLSLEQEKYSSQMQKYYQAMQLMDGRQIRMGLYFPLLSAWKEYNLG